MANIDASQLVMDWLRTDADASSIRALILGGELNIFEAGDLTEDILTTAKDTRRAGANLNLVLAVSVADAGERMSSNGRDTDLFVHIRIFDRDRGNSNIRVIREKIISQVVKKFAVNEVVVAEAVAVKESYFTGRTGYRYDRVQNVEYEVIQFRMAGYRALQID